MPRTGLLIFVAGALIAAAAGVLVWTNYFGLPHTQELVTNANSNKSQEEKLIDAMQDVANTNGFAATFQPNDNHKWEIADGHKLERIQSSNANVGFARISSMTPVNPEVVHLGAALMWPAALTQKFNGKRIQIGIIARSPSANATTEFEAVFATRQAGNSGWQKLSLTPTFKLVSFQYDVPAVAEGYQSEPMLVIHADPEGRGRSMEILGVVVRQAPE